MQLVKHVREGKLILVIYDNSLVGTQVHDGIKQLDFTSSFYQGTEANKNEIEHLLNRAQFIHAAGSETITFLEQAGFPVKDTVTVIGGVPFIQLLQE